jgi:vitamin B12 transporter
LYGQWGANADLEPEKSKHLDAGLQWLLPGGKNDLRVTVFDRQVDNAIAYTSKYTNLDAQHDKGFEVESTVRLSEKLSIRTFYAYVTGEITTKTWAETDTTYNNLLRRPKHTFGVNVGFQATPRVYTSINLKTFSSRKDVYYNNAFDQIFVTLDSYQLVDLYAEYKFKVFDDQSLKIFADLKNILDQDYMEVYGYTTLGLNVTGGILLTF